MGGALMQLVAYGAQDAYLTGNAKVTMFKVSYRRHTNFAMEPMEISIDSVEPGSRVSIILQRNADLASRMYTRFTTPTLVSSTPYSGKVAWVNRLGHAIIDYAQVIIGGNSLDKHYGIWLDIWYELTHTVEQDRGYNAMIGNVPELTTLQSQVPGGYVIFSPCQFWWNRNYGLALPLLALQYHEVRIDIQFERIDNLVVFTVDEFGRKPDFNGIRFGNSSLLVDYIYLDGAERHRFAQYGHEYLIEQLQQQTLTPQAIAQSNSNTSEHQSLPVTFNHPVKEMIVTQRVGAWNGSNKSNLFLGYSSIDTPDAWEDALQKAAQHLVRGMIDPTAQTGTDVTVTSPVSTAPIIIQTAVTIPADQGTFLVQGGNDAGTVYRITLLNASEDEDTTFGINNYPLIAPLPGSTFNLADTLRFVTLDLVRIDLDDGGYTVRIANVIVTNHNLTLEDISTPTNELIDTRFSSATHAKTTDDIHVVMPQNYGLRIDGKGNMVVKGRIVLNGNDRFNDREGSYWNYVQPWQHHTHTPADGINLYSFALHPEQHQPSGTVNCSRIDSIRIEMDTTDTLKNNRKTPFNIYLSTIIYIFAVNYNIFRVFSGMGGPAYNN